MESALIEHAAVAEVGVVGNQRRRRLVKPKAFVVRGQRAGRRRRAGAETLKDFVKSKLAPYKYPRWIEFVPELPKTATGKIQRFRLR
ncbi:MAG: hypothetical protein R3E84_04645 [Pseudomonadales bacterium]